MEKPVLSTMVVLYNTNLHFDTTKLAEIIPLNEHLIKVEKRGVVKRGESKRDKIKRRSKKEPATTTGFCHNSLTLVLLNDGGGELPQKEITVKIFQNGVFHMTGILDDRYDQSVVQILLSMLWKDCKDAIRESPDIPQILNRRVVLMNYTTKFTEHKTVPRELLHNNIRNLRDPLVSSHYDPDVYPGVKVCVGEGKWTAKVFRTGKIILTGITDKNECAQFTEQLLALFEKVLLLKPTSESMLSKPVQRSMH